MSVDRRQLMLLLDDELSETQARLFARQLAKDPEAVDYVDSLLLVGRLVREVTDERMLRAPDLTDSVMARIAAESAPRAPVKAAFWRPLAPALGLALAMAAAVAFVVRSSDPQPPAHQRLAFSHLERGAAAALAIAGRAGAQARPEAAQRTTPLTVSATGAATAAEPAVSIENVDFGGHNGVIFMVSAGGPRATPVVWLSDPPAGTRARMRSL